MFKKIAIALLSCVLSVVPVHAAAWVEAMPSYLCDECETDDSIDEKHHRIEFNKDLMEELGMSITEHMVIPETVNHHGEEYTVVGIGDSCFQGNANLISVQLPETIVYIKPFAFNECANLESINLPQGIKGIGLAAFQLCHKLKNAVLPESLEYLGGFGFNHCDGMNGSTFYIPSSVKQLGENPQYPAHMFYNFATDDFKEFDVSEDNEHYIADDGILYSHDKSLLVSIPRGKVFDSNTYIMPDSVTSLGELSFSRNKHVNKVVISDNLLIDGDVSDQEWRFYNNVGNNLAVACYVYSGVQEYDVKPTNPNYTAVDGILYTKDMKKMVAVPNQYNGMINIPEGVETWEQEAVWTEVDYFKDLMLSQVSEIRIPSTMKDISKYQITTINDMMLYNGTKITVDEDNPYYEVSSSGRLKKKEYSEEALYYTTCNLNFRESPVDGEVRKVESPNTAVWIETVEDGWGKDTHDRWVKMDYLTQ